MDILTNTIYGPKETPNTDNTTNMRANNLRNEKDSHLILPSVTNSQSKSYIFKNFHGFIVDFESHNNNYERLNV